MTPINFTKLTADSIDKTFKDIELCKTLLTSNPVTLLPLLNAAYSVRHHYWKNKVKIHVLNNVQNGYCPEDCNYCSQSKHHDTEIESYPMKSHDEILAEAKSAHESGAFRYCMVLSGRGPTQRRVDTVCDTIKDIKSKFPLEVCLSAGLVSDEMAQQLKSAGLDRLNHNLNTSKSRYPNICTTHTYDDRVNTLESAKKAGLETCSGLIVGMGETADDIIELGLEFKQLEVPSIPVNFFLPIEGTPLPANLLITPEYCLRVLCVLRFLNPDAEIRIAAGREYHLRSMQSMGLYPANSLFMEGYLNATGDSTSDTIQMIQDAGFEVDSSLSIDGHFEAPTLKSRSELKPFETVTQ